MTKEEELSQKMHDNAMKAASIMGEYLEGKQDGSELVKQASLTITQYFKYRATRGVEAGIKLAVIKMIAKDAEEMRRIIGSALPEYGISRALTE